MPRSAISFLKIYVWQVFGDVYYKKSSDQEARNITQTIKQALRYGSRDQTAILTIKFLDRCRRCKYREHTSVEVTTPCNVIMAMK